MKYIKLLWLCTALFVVQTVCAQNKTGVAAYLTYPEPGALTSVGSKLAWTYNDKGKRNVYVAEGPDYTERALTPYTEDDGQEISNVSISSDGKWVVYVRGGDHGGNWSSTVAVNGLSEVVTPKVQVWSIPFEGGEPVLLGTGSYPEISPTGKEVAFLRSGQVWVAPIDGSRKAKKMFSVRGTARLIEWSPSGEQLAFVASRSTHSFIAVYKKGAEQIRWIAPSFSKDLYPTWSPDEQSLAFVRLPGSTSMKDSILADRHRPWEIMVADVASGKAHRLWKAPETLRGSVPTTHGRYNLHWVAKDRVVFLSRQDGWSHLYSIPAKGGEAICLTPGNFMIEELQVSGDKTQLLFSANTGSDPQRDIDLRHIATVSVDKADMKMLTEGTGAESLPVYLDGGKGTAFLSSTPTRPALVALQKKGEKDFSLIGESHVAALEQQAFVTPEQVIYKAPDGLEIHGQLFEKKDGKKNKPAILFIHGGPSRQMMLSWDHRGYYAHTYALNQYLAEQGFVVLSINYRLGIGYGYDFHNPANAGRRGASEYQDIRAAGEWLAAQDQVDPKRIGVYGGSYGGYLTALALGKNSDIFAAGVDIHGVHTRVPSKPYASIYEHAPDAAEADRVAWESSPIAYVNTWKSPVLLIHADDDRNVGFAQSVDLVQRLEKQGVDYETLVIPNDTHHWMVHHNAVTISEAAVEYLKRKLQVD